MLWGGDTADGIKSNKRHEVGCIFDRADLQGLGELHEQSISCKYCESDSISIYTGKFAKLIINPEIQTCLFIHLVFDKGFI